MKSDEKKEYDKTYFQEHKNELVSRNKEYMQAHPEQRRKKVERELSRRRTIPEVAEKARESTKKWRKDNPDKQKESLVRWKFSLRVQVLTHYGHGELACVMCNFSDMRALSIDHINNNGAEHRRNNASVKAGGTNFYLWLKKQGYPEEYQTLCFNCQIIKRVTKQGSTG